MKPSLTLHSDPVIDYLTRIPLFADLTRHELTILNLDLQQFEAMQNQEIYKADAKQGKFVYIVKQG